MKKKKERGKKIFKKLEIERFDLTRQNRSTFLAVNDKKRKEKTTTTTTTRFN